MANVSYVSDADVVTSAATAVFTSFAVSGTDPAIIITSACISQTISSVVLSAGLTGGTPYQVGTVTNGTTVLEVWAVPAPSGTGTITVTYANSTDIRANAVLVNNANQTTPCPIADTATNTGVSPLSVTPSNLTSSDAAIGIGANTVGGDGPSWTVGTQTFNDNSGNVNAAGGYHLGTGAVTVTWVGDSNDAIIAVRVAANAASAAVTGTATASINEGDVVTGGKTVILTLTGDTFVAAAGTPTYNAANTAGTTAADSAGGGGARSSNGTLTCTFPSGYTATAGHFAFMILYSDQGSGSVPTDWAEVSGSPWGAGTEKLQAFYKVLVGGESAPATTISGSTTNMSHVAQMVIYTGVGSIGAVGTPSNGTGTPMTAGAVTTTADNSIVLFCCGRGDNESSSGQTFNASSTGVNERLDGGTAAGNDSQVSMADKSFPTSGTSSGAGSSTTSATDPWVGVMVEIKPSTPFADARAAIRNGLDSAQSESAGWDAKVKGNIPVANVVRTSNTVCTITLQAQSDYNITATETITATIPASALTGGAQIVATPTFTVASSGGTSLSAPGVSHTYTSQATQVRAQVAAPHRTYLYLLRVPTIPAGFTAVATTHTYTGRDPITSNAMVPATASHTYTGQSAQAMAALVPPTKAYTYTPRTPQAKASVMPLKASHTFDPKATQVRALVAVPFRTHVYTARQVTISGASNIPTVDHAYTARTVQVQLVAYYGEAFHAYTPIAPKASASVMPAARTHTYTVPVAGLRAKINPPNHTHTYLSRTPQAKPSLGVSAAAHSYNAVQPATLTGNAFAVPVTLHVYVGRPGELRAKVQSLQTTHAYTPAAPNTKAVMRPVQVVHAYTGRVPDVITGAILHPPEVTHVYLSRTPQAGTGNVRVIPGHPLGRGRR